MKNTPTVVSIINLKGGVGKTTVTALLARYAAQQGLDVLAVDLDPQANLSQALMTGYDYLEFMEKKQPSIVELFNDFAPATEHKPGPSPLQPSDVLKIIKGYRKDIKLEIIPSRFDFSDNLVDSTKVDEKALANFIAKNMQHKDLILIDCAPTESVLTRASYHASRYVLIPVKLEFFSTIGFPLMKKSLEHFRSGKPGHEIDVCGVVVRNTKTSGSGYSKDGRDSRNDIRKKAKAYGWDIFDNWMHHSDSYPRWANDPLAGHLRNAAKEWPKVAEEILTKINLNKQAAT